MFCRWGWSSWLPSSPKTCCPIGTTRYDTLWIMWTVIYTILIRPGMIHYELPELWYMLYWYNQMIGHKLGRTFQVSMFNFLLVLLVNYKILKKTLPKAQRTQGLSSAYQSNFFRAYHKFLHKSWSNISFKILTIPWNLFLKVWTKN